jgi:hypothetical protein
VADDSLAKDPNSRVPVPDPTLLTTQALIREIASLRELMETQVAALEDVEDQKFFKVEQQFELVERQRVEQKKDTKDAVDAALTAQKEAVREQTAASERAIAKSEAATSKQLDQLSITFTTAIAAIQRELGEMKERLTAIEQQRLGAKEDRTGLYATLGTLATFAFLAIAVVTLIATRG